MRKGQVRGPSLRRLEVVRNCAINQRLRLTEQRAISSKVSADGIGCGILPRMIEGEVENGGAHERTRGEKKPFRS